MKRNQILKILVCLIGFCVHIKAQTNLPDNMMTVDCMTDAVEQPWDAHVLHSVNDIHCYYVPIVGDIDGDGTVEIVAAKTVTNDHYTSQVGIYRGTDLQQIGTINVSHGFTRVLPDRWLLFAIPMVTVVCRVLSSCTVTTTSSVPTTYMGIYWQLPI